MASFYGLVPEEDLKYALTNIEGENRKEALRGILYNFGRLILYYRDVEYAKKRLKELENEDDFEKEPFKKLIERVAESGDSIIAGHWDHIAQDMRELTRAIYGHLT